MLKIALYRNTITYRRRKTRVRRCINVSCNKACDLQRYVLRRSSRLSKIQVSEFFGVGKKILMSVGGACDRRKRLALKYFCRRSRMRFRCLVHKRVRRRSLRRMQHAVLKSDPECCGRARTGTRSNMER